LPHPLVRVGGMGYAGKFQERERARQLRADAWTLQEIAAELGVVKSTVSLWVRDVQFVPKPRNRGHAACKPHPLKLAKEAQIEQCRVEAIDWVGRMSERELTLFALGLYAGEGAKSGREVSMANTNPALLVVFATWLRRTFEIDESRLKVVVYLHDGLDIDAASAYWSEVLRIPTSQFGKPYRAVADPSIRRAKHLMGCATVRYGSTLTARRVLAMIAAITSAVGNPG
jgi:hypothetical protein